MIRTLRINGFKSIHSEVIELGRVPATTFQYPTADDDKAALALRIDQAVREQAPAGWKGDPAREAQVLNALFPLLDRDREATPAVFEIIKNQPGY